MDFGSAVFEKYTVEGLAMSADQYPNPLIGVLASSEMEP
jgi:hypothetical protein